jgi:hypothetical protein
MKSGSRGDMFLTPPLPRASARILFLFLITEAEPESIRPVSIRPVSIWIAIITPVIRPVVVVVGIIVPSPVITSIRITIVSTIPVATIPVATIPVSGISLIAIATPLRYVTVCATLRICGWGKRRRNRKREDAHQRQRN